ncbi:MAG: transcription termination/antitermination protein NusG [Oscillospiraceae bacterium]|jgi:transcriptional antiterminator NusG|nr:transcription termination/antitermination protein NusG [Oscillospiraceae bacterium]
MQKEAEWYIVHTYSGYENKVASNLEKIVETRGLKDLIKEIFIPTQIVSEIKDNKKREVERKIFPGYVIIKMVLTDESWYVVRGIKGCIGFVSSSDKPIPLTEEEVKKFGMNETKTVEVSYDIGDSVQITDGPLEDFVGTVTKLEKERDYVLVIVSMFGREVPVELKLGQVQVMD